MAADAELDSGPMVLEPGSVIADRYRILDILGHGGMGVVYKAQHIHMDKIVAIKMMLQPNTSVSSQDYRRFQREAQAASMVDHPNIVSIHDFGYFDKQAYLCMDYLSGTSLDQIILQAPLKLDEFRHIFKQACDALQHAHDKGLIHRDLKPSNIMITERRNDPLFPVILDLGLVKLINGGEFDQSDPKLTMTNMVVGSPLYMSPEQCRAQAVDHRSDIYALGCVMYEALTGVPPLRADTLFDIMSKHISEFPKPLRDEAKGVYVPAALERLIFKAMAKAPEDRVQSMQELAQGIEHAFSGAPELPVSRLGSTASGIMQVGNASSITRKKTKKQNQLLIGLSIAVGATLIFMIPAGIMYNSYLQKEANRPAPAPGSPGAAAADSSSGANSSKSLSTTTEQSANPISGFFSAPLFSNNSQNKVAQAPSKSSMGTGGSTTPGALPGVAYTPGLTPPVTPSATQAAVRPSNQAEPSSNSLPEPSFSRPFSSTPPVKAPSLDSLLNEGNFAYNRRDYAEARLKYLDAMQLHPSRDLYGATAAKLAVCAFQLRDLNSLSQYLQAVKDTYSFSTVTSGNYPFYWEIAQICVQIGDKDPAFMEKLLTDVIQAHERKTSSPDRELIRMRMELNRAYIDQGKYDNSKTLLQKTLADANAFPEEAAVIKQHLSQLFPPAQNSGGSPGNGPYGNGGPEGGYAGPGGQPGGPGGYGGPPPYGGPPGGGPPGGGPGGPGGGFGGPPGGPRQ